MILPKTKILSSIIVGAILASTISSSAFAIDTPVEDIPVSTKQNLTEVKPDEYVIVSTEGTNDALLSSMPSYKEIMNVEGNTTALLTKAEAETVVSKIPDATISTDTKFTLSGTITQNPAPTWGIDRIDSPTYVSDNTYQYDSDGTGTKVYIIDSGINAHSDYSARLLSGYDGVGDGYGTTDCDGHGTFVAGLVGGTTYGVAKDVSLIPVRIFDCTASAYSTDLINGINWVISNHSGGKGIINMSLGGGASVAVDNAVQAAIDAGFVVITAAGNGGEDQIGDDACLESPGRLAGAYNVAASNTSNVITDWSNIGSCVDIVAPGESIKSTWITSSTATATGSGTSFSAPIVAGIAARYWELNPSYTTTQITNLMSTNSVKNLLSNASSKNTVNQLAYIASEVPPPTPTVSSAPTNLTSSNIKETSFDLSWSAPTDNGGADITDYIIEYSSNSGSTWTTIEDGINTNTTVSVTGLTSQTEYMVSVSAVNSIGTSSPVTATVTTSAPVLPSPVTNIRVASNIYGSTSIAWTAPTNTGSAPVTDYVVKYSRDGGTTWYVLNDGVNTNTSFTMKYPAPGVFYRFSVEAKTSVGLSTPVTITVKTISLSKPSAPRSLTLKSNLVNKITLSWLPPLSSGSSPVTDYIITYSADGGKTWLTYTDPVSSSTTVAITGLPSKTQYTFMVKAKNSVGVSQGVTIKVTSR